MSISFRTGPGIRVVELGGGDCPSFRPNVDVRPCVNAAGEQMVDFTADFNEPLPIGDQDFDGVYSRYVIEHLSWRKVKQFLAECWRILKPGGKLAIITANTARQFEWIQKGLWETEAKNNKDEFEACSSILFGDQDYPENAHKNFLTPHLVTELLTRVGFQNVLVQPVGEFHTDMLVEAVKPSDAPQQAPQGQQTASSPLVLAPTPPPFDPGTYRPEDLFDIDYFDGGQAKGGYALYLDFPCHEISAHRVLDERPQSVLELGCGRGYVLKRIQDAGIEGAGFDVSLHCFLARVCEGITRTDLTQNPHHEKVYDLCYSIAFWDHIPEPLIPRVVDWMRARSKRGIHGINFAPAGPGDQTRFTIRPREWWQAQMPDGHLVVNKDELEQGTLPDKVLRGDGKVKLNLGCGLTMFHHGWLNVDREDLGQVAQQMGYRFLRHDLTQGIPLETGSVDLIYCAHALEHFSYDQGLSFLRDCRRVLKKGGAMRVIVPDAATLNTAYTDAELWQFDQLNQSCRKAPEPDRARRLYELLYAGHQSVYDFGTLAHALVAADFNVGVSHFRQQALGNHPQQQIARETLDVLPCLSLYVNAVPRS